MCALRAADLLLKPSAPLARQRGCPAIAHRCGFGADVSNGNELEQGFGELLSCDWQSLASRLALRPLQQWRLLECAR